jgi:hypothetical protein
MSTTDIAGQRFGRLIAVAERGRNKARQALWECLCDCGATIVALRGNLNSGKSKSCGCARRETCMAVGDRVRTHGMSRTPTYNTWRAMLDRCRRETSKDYCRYGARGVSVCDRWMTFANFLADMGERPAGKSLDRWPNGNGNYEPGNCRWATPREQNINRSVAHMVAINGETKCLTEWIEQAAVAESTVRRRMSLGMSLEEALFTSSWSPAAKLNGTSAQPVAAAES